MRSRESHSPGERFRLYVKTFDESGNVDIGNCGWVSVDPRVEMVREMSDAKVFTNGKPGHGSAEDWARFFMEEEPEWKVSVSWAGKPAVGRSGPGRPSSPSRSNPASPRP